MKFRLIILLLLGVLFIGAIATSCSQNVENRINNDFGLMYKTWEKRDDWVFYIDLYNKKLCKVKVNGEEQEELCEDSILQFDIQGDCIYFVNNDDNHYLYSINLDGSGKKKLMISEYNGIKPTQFQVKDVWIYFIDFNGYLNRVKIDGTELSKLFNYPCKEFSIYDEHVYFVTSKNRTSIGFELLKMNIDGTQLEQLTQEKSWVFDFDDTSIYYVNIDENGIYKQSFEINEKQRIVDNNSSSIIKVIGDWVYFSDDSGTYKVKTDGSELTKVSDNIVYLLYDVWDNWLICTGIDNFFLIKISESAETDEIIKSIMSEWPNVEFFE